VFFSVADVPSGNLKELYQGQAAEADFKWQAQYGNVIRFKGVFGVCNSPSALAAHSFWLADPQEDQLMVSDPAALQYMLVKSGYRFAKPENRRVFSEMIHGRGVTWAEGRFLVNDRSMRQFVINVWRSQPQTTAKSDAACIR
jgi:hypothetical protein